MSAVNNCRTKLVLKATSPIFNFKLNLKGMNELFLLFLKLWKCFDNFFAFQVISNQKPGLISSNHFQTLHRLYPVRPRAQSLFDPESTSEHVLQKTSAKHLNNESIHAARPGLRIQCCKGTFTLSHVPYRLWPKILNSVPCLTKNKYHIYEFTWNYYNSSVDLCFCKVLILQIRIVLIL